MLISKKTSELSYLYKDNSAEKTIIMIHGYGASGDDLAFFSKRNPEIASKYNWIFPQGFLKVEIFPGYSGRAWFPIDINRLQEDVALNDQENILTLFPIDLSTPRQIILSILEDLDISPSQVIIGGFSQGGILAVDTALHSEESFLGIVSFSGSFINQKELQELSKNHQSSKYFISHGVKDSVLPHTLSNDLNSMLKNNGLQGQYFSFDGSHEITLDISKYFYEFLSLLV